MRLLVFAALCTIAFAGVVDPAQNVEIDTPGNYFWFPSPLPGETCTIKFQVQATRDAVITFSTQKSLINHVYQAILGAEDNEYVCIVRGLGTIPIVDRSWRNILTGEWQTFLVEYCNGQLSVKREVGGQTEDLATYTDNNPYSGSEWYVGVTSLFARSKWQVLSSESCGITDQRDPEPLENNQPEEDNGEPAGDDVTDEDDGQEQIAGGDSQSGSSNSGTSGEQERGSSDNDGQEQVAGGDSQSGSSNSGTSGEQERGSSDDDGQEQIAGDDSQSGSSNSGTSGGQERGSSDDDGQEQIAGGDSQSGSSNSGTSGEQERGSSDNDGEEQVAGGDSQSGSSNSGTSGEQERGSSDDDGQEQIAGGDSQSGSSNSGTSGGQERGSSDDDGQERISGGVSQSGSSDSGTSGEQEKGTSDDEGAPDGNTQGSNNEIFQIDIHAEQTVQWKYIDEEIASPYNLRIPFGLQAGRDCYIRLASGKYQEPKEYYDIMIGFRENRFVCISRLGTTVKDEYRPDVLIEGAFVDFVLSFDGKTVQLEKGGQVLASYIDDLAFKSLRYIGILSHADGKTIDSWWRFNKNSFVFSEQTGWENEVNPAGDSNSSEKSSSSKSS